MSRTTPGQAQYSPCFFFFVKSVAGRRERRSTPAPLGLTFFGVGGGGSKHKPAITKTCFFARISRASGKILPDTTSVASVILAPRWHCPLVFALNDTVSFPNDFWRHVRQFAPPGYGGLDVTQIPARRMNYRGFSGHCRRTCGLEFAVIKFARVTRVAVPTSNLDNVHLRRVTTPSSL